MATFRQRSALFLSPLMLALVQVVSPTPAAADDGPIACSTEGDPNRLVSGLVHDQFGSSVALEGDVAVIGAPFDDLVAPDAGAVHVCFLDGGVWWLAETLTASDGEAGDWFGGAVALSGDWIVIGAQGHNASAGAAYVFERTDIGWFERQELGEDLGDGVPSAGDRFGVAVDISGPSIVVGAYGDDTFGPDAGAAWVFARLGDLDFRPSPQVRIEPDPWVGVAQLLADDAAEGDYFGWSVAVAGPPDIGFVDPPFDPSPVASKADLTPPIAHADPGPGPCDEPLPIEVEASPVVVVVGAYADDGMAGSAYVFEGSWPFGLPTCWQKLTASDQAAGDRFGHAVDVALPYIVVGSYLDDDGGDESGSAYMFEVEPLVDADPGPGADIGPGPLEYVWVEKQKLTASDAAAGDRFGYAVAIDADDEGSVVIVGAYNDDVFGPDSGSVYVFVPGSPWFEAAKLTAPDGAADDRLGQAVALDASIGGIVGAPQLEGVPGFAYFLGEGEEPPPPPPPSPPADGSMAAFVDAGETVCTENNGVGATPGSPVETCVTSPNPGAVFVTPGPTSGGSGFMLFGVEVSISAPAATSAAPLAIQFAVDTSALPPGVDPASMIIFKDGLPVPDCAGSPGVGLLDPCVSDRGSSGDDFTITVLTSTASDWAFGAVGTFTDDNGSEFEADIQWLATNGVTNGCGQGLFCPDDPVTRGEMAAFLVRALGYTDPGPGDLFVDDDDSQFEDEIDRLATAGVTHGCGPGIFCPDDPVTREQFAAFLVRAMGYTDDGGGHLFIDTSSSAFEFEIDCLATAGVTRGCGPVEFCPNGLVTRAELAAFLHRALG